MVKCFYCDKEMLEHTATQIAFDVPYINVYIHKECEKIIDKIGVDEYIQDNKQRFLELVSKNAVEFGTQQPAPTGRQTKSKILAKPTKKTKKLKLEKHK